MSSVLIVAQGEADRVDRFLRKRFPDAPRRELAKLFDQAGVRRGQDRLSKGDHLRVGDEIEVSWIPASRSGTGPEPEMGPLNVLYEDESMVAINKPPAMPTHPLEAGELGTAANLVAQAYPECATASEDPREGGAVHRLDTGTSGVLVFARTAQRYASLRAAFRQGKVDKRYLVATTKLPNMKVIDVALEQRGRRAIVSPDGAPCMTEWKQLSQAGGYHLLECRTRSGRMHQVRAHLAHGGAPIVGDALYGGAEALPGTTDFFLHASELTLVLHPPGVTIRAPLPHARQVALQALGLPTDGLA